MQLSDRELLELAAKAAGIRHWKDDELWDNWNPLDDSCDAFYLMVKRGMTVAPFPAGARVRYQNHILDTCEVEVLDDSPYAATRRAITRAAAAIGKEMP